MEQAVKRRKYECEICKQSFDREERLKKHIESEHLNNRVQQEI